ncbi:MAG: histidine kinase [Chloroflexia bacterium]|nr:histidine kinase [Chloroflexia bacterium]
MKWTQNKPFLHIQNLKIIYLDTIFHPHYQLNSHQNNIEISYVGISYKSNKKLLYKYQLLPYDEKWKITHSTSINYSSLLPGSYEFRIMAMNESGNWSDINNSIKFTIDYPFYKKWWFYVLSVLFLTLVVFLSLQYMLQKIREENKLRTELKRHAQKSIAAQLNPHFIFNSLNSLNYLILKNDKLESSKYLSKLSTYLRATFDALQKEELTLYDEIKIVSQYLKLERIRLKEKLNYEIVLDDFIDSQDYKIPGLFILPLLENAIWKRIQAKKDQGFIKITIEKYENHILVLIEDNGIMISLEEADNEESNIEQKKQLLNDFYKGQIIFDFTPNTMVSFNEMGNVIKLKLFNKFR